MYNMSYSQGACMHVANILPTLLSGPSALLVLAVQYTPILYWFMIIVLLYVYNQLVHRSRMIYRQIGSRTQ